MGSSKIPYKFWEPEGPKKVVNCQKLSAHSRHTHFETSVYSVFRSTKRQHFDEKCCVFVPCGCKYWSGVHPIVLAEKFGARRWFYIPWTLFNDQNSCLHNSLNLGTFHVFWEFWDSTFYKPFRMLCFLKFLCCSISAAVFETFQTSVFSCSVYHIILSSFLQYFVWELLSN